MISQDAFDSMVLENMDDFDLTKPEALAETISQLSTMGKDLSNIDITGGEGRDELLECIKYLKDMSPASSGGEAVCNKLLIRLTEICHDKHPLGLRNQNMMRTNGGLSALISAINTSYPPEVLTLVLNLVTILSKTNGKLIRYFTLQYENQVPHILYSCIRCIS